MDDIRNWCSHSGTWEYAYGMEKSEEESCVVKLDLEV